MPPPTPNRGNPLGGSQSDPLTRELIRELRRLSETLKADSRVRGVQAAGAAAASGISGPPPAAGASVHDIYNALRDQGFAAGRAQTMATALHAAGRGIPGPANPTGGAPGGGGLAIAGAPIGGRPGGYDLATSPTAWQPRTSAGNLPFGYTSAPQNFNPAPDPFTQMQGGSTAKAPNFWTPARAAVALYAAH